MPYEFWLSPEEHNDTTHNIETETIYKIAAEMKLWLSLIRHLAFIDDSDTIISIYNLLKQLYEFEPNFFYYYSLELDPLSIHYNGNKSTAINVANLKLLFPTVIDALFFTDNIDALEKVLNEGKDIIMPFQYTKYYYYLIFYYNKKISPELTSREFASPIDHKINKVKRIRRNGQVIFDKFVINYFSENNIDINTYNIYSLIIDFLKNGSISVNDYWDTLFKRNKIKSTTNYTKIKSQHRQGLFSEFYPDSLYILKKGHSISKNNMLPILVYKEETNSNKNELIDFFEGDFTRKAMKELSFSTEFRNYFRKLQGIPSVGEVRWISEIALLTKVKEIFNPLKVVHQWSPSWLGIQRIDIGIPDINIGIEYNGKQHYEPIDFFGGEEGLKKTKLRDELKKLKCKKSNVTLIEIKYDMPSDEVLILLNKLLPEKC